MAFQEFDGELDAEPGAKAPRFVEFSGQLDEVKAPSIVERLKAFYAKRAAPSAAAAEPSDFPSSDPMGTGAAEILAQPNADSRSVLERPMPGYREMQAKQYGDAVQSGDTAALVGLSQDNGPTPELLRRAEEVKAKRAATVKEAASTRDAATTGFDAMVSLAKGGNNVMQLPLAAFAPSSDAYKWTSENGRQLAAMESPQLKARRQLMAERIAESPDELGKFFTSLNELVTNPSLGFSVAAEQLPIAGAILAAGGLGALGGRAVIGTASRFSPAVALADAIGGGSVSATAATRGALFATGTASAIGSGGDAAQGTFDQLMDRQATPDALLQANPDYQAMVSKGMAPIDARRAIATSKARLAAVLAAPLGVLSGVTGVEAVAAGSVKRGGLMTGLKTAGAEMAGELPEELGTQVASNYASSQVDPRQSLTEGLGETAAQTLIGTAPTAVTGGIHAGTGQRIEVDNKTRPLPSLFDQSPQGVAAQPIAPIRVEDQPTTPMTPEEILSAPSSRIDVNNADAVLAQLGLGQHAKAQSAATEVPEVNSGNLLAQQFDREQRLNFEDQQQAEDAGNSLAKEPSGQKSSREEISSAYKTANGFFGKDTIAPAIQNDWQRLLDAADARDAGKLSALEEKYRADEERDGLGAGTSGAGPGRVKQSRRGAAQIPRFARAIRQAIEREGASKNADAQAANTSGGEATTGPVASEPIRRANAATTETTADQAPEARATPTATPAPVVSSAGPAAMEARGLPAKPRKKVTSIRGSSALGAISTQLNGISPTLIADLSRKVQRTRTSKKTGKVTPYTAWDNPLHSGYGQLFRASGTADLTEIARVLEEEGFIEKGTLERDYLEARAQAEQIVKNELLGGGSTLRQGDADSVDAEMQRRREMAQDGVPDALFDGLTEDDLAESGYADASPEVKAATERLLADAESAGLDTEALREDAARVTEGKPEDEYHLQLQAAIRQAVQAVGQDSTNSGQVDTGAARPGGEDRSQATGGEGTQSEGLTSPTAERLAAADKRAREAEAADRAEQKRLADKASADAQRDEFTLTGSDRPADVAAAAGQKDIFSDAEPNAVTRQKKTPAKIDDFGEKLEGARKDYAATLKDAESVDVAAEPLSKSWPEPDYQKLLDGGADPFIVAFIRAARDEVPTKPQKSWRLKGWVTSVQTLRTAASHLMDGSVSKDRVLGLLNSGAYDTVRDNVGSRAELYELVGHQHSLKGVTFAKHHYTLYRGEQNVTKWVVEQKAKATLFSNWPRELAVADTKAEMLAQFKDKIGSLDLGKKAKGQSSQFVIYRKRGQTGAWIGKKIGREYVDLHKAEDVTKARAYMADHVSDLEAKMAKYRETPYERRDENQPRVGDDHRNGAPVTPDVFMQTFGFRGVQFGNYVEQDRRQSDLNEAFDGLMDLAAVLGVPPRALSLNGTLGLAFGARGKGGKRAPAAHFEPGNIVINLTKGGGPGSLAHEWWHGLDNYFARQAGGTSGLITGGAPMDRLRPQLQGAYKSVRIATQAPTLRKRAAELDKRRSKPYWNTPEELSARAFESYVIAKLKDQGAANDYLANVVDEKVWNLNESARSAMFGEDSVESYPYPGQAELPAVRAAFDDFFKTVETRTEENGNVAMFSRSQGYGDAVDSVLDGATPESASVQVSGSLPVLEALGLPSLPVATTGDRLAKMHYDHGLTRSDLKALPELLANPVMVFDSATKPGSKVLVLDLWRRGSPVIAAIHPNVQLKRVDVSLLASAYPKDRPDQLGAWFREKLLRYADKDKTRAWATNGGVQFPWLVQLQRGSGSSVIGPGDVGKPALSRPKSGERRSADRRIEDVTHLVEQITARWENAPEVVVVEDMSDPRVPESIRAEDTRQQSQGATGAPEGIYYKGKVYLVASELRGDADVVRVLFHEALGHAGLRGTFGNELGGILDKIALVNEAKVRAKAEQYGLDFSKPGERRAAAEEVLAELAQKRPENGLVQSAIDAIRTFLRDHVPGFARMRMTDSELIRNFILPARAFVERGRPAAESPDPGMTEPAAMFSRSTSITSAPEDETTPAKRKAASPWLDSLGRLQFAPGAWAYSKITPVITDRLLTPLKLNAMPKELRGQLRAMKQQIEQAKEVAVKVAAEGFKLSEADRTLVSDIIEGEMAAGTVPPAHAARMAAGINAIMDQQTNDLVELGMLSSESAERWRGAYLPRFYRSKMMQTLREGGAELWALAARKAVKKPTTLQGIKGEGLKGRGRWQTVPTTELKNWQDLGWEVRDPEYEAGVSPDVQVWRDYTREEREKMGEIRDAGFRFTMGYLRTQRDIALGRLFASVAADRSLSAKTGRQPEGWVQVPDGSIPGTGGVKRYGKLAGMWVSKEVFNHLENHDQGISDAMRLYRKALGMWKEGKTVLNPVSHFNNLAGNLSMAHFAGVSYWDAHKYAGAIRDLVRNAPMVREAKEAGLFLGTMTQEELLATMPKELRAMAAMQASKTEAAADWVWNALSLWLRRPAGKLYEAEDQFFRYLIYRDARTRGMEQSDAVDYSQRYVFAYDDLPKGAKLIRDFGIPFFSYTYKAIPSMLHTAVHYPHRMLAPAALMWGLNAAMYAIASGEDDEDWLASIMAYINDPARRAKADEIETDERENLPPWMKGNSSLLGTPKAVRLGINEATGLPMFWDISQIMPGGNMFDVENDAGGIGWPQSMMPSHPLMTTMAAMFWNKDTFFGKDIVDDNDTAGERFEKRADWLWKQFTPAIAIGNYHTERLANVIAQLTGEPVRWWPKDATGVGKDGLPVQPELAALQTVGIKARPIDTDLSEKIDKGQRAKMIRDIDAEMRRLRRLAGKGALSSRNLDAAEEIARDKKQRLREGLTVDGEAR